MSRITRKHEPPFRHVGNCAPEGRREREHAIDDGKGAIEDDEREQCQARPHEGEHTEHDCGDPAQAVVVEGGDALVWLDIVGPRATRNAGDEAQDRRLRYAVVPRQQRIGRERLRQGAGPATK
jgi:hypothetical protein